MNKIHNKEDKAYMVLGTPHTATSFVIKALEKCGITVRHNMRSYGQSLAVVKLNDKILKEAGGEWVDPPKEEDIMAVDAEESIKEIIESKKDELWAIKDPRFSLTGKKFLKHMDGDVYLICCFRKKDKILESFEHNMSNKKLTSEGVDEYNKSIISIIKEFCGL